MLVDKAQLMNLSAPEMTVLIGGLRVLNANNGQSKDGVFTKRPETLTNDFFVNLLDMRTESGRSPAASEKRARRPRPKIGRARRTGTIVDLIFGSNPKLRAIAEVSAAAATRNKPSCEISQQPGTR